MAKIRRNEKREMPALNTSSLPDIIFMLLFFFMSVTSMKEVTYKVQFTVPSATELTKLEKKSLVRYIYVGTPTAEFTNNMVQRHVFSWTMRLQRPKRLASIS